MEQINLDMINELSEELPPEVQDIVDEMRANQFARIEMLGKEVARKRDEAVKARKASGIEVIWQEDEEYYEGIDEANRDQHIWLKSGSTSGGISRQTAKTNNRCTAFFNITRQFCESASARMGDILLPAGDWNFSVGPTPVQDEPLEDALPQMAAVAPPSPPQGAPMLPPPTGAPNAAGMPVAPGAPVPPPAGAPALPPPPPDPMTAAQSDADKKAEKAEAKIRDWLVECSYHTEVRKVLEDACIIGTGVLKGPIPAKMKSRKATQTEDGMVLDISIETNPASKRVDPWDFFPDPACGEDIHAGNYVLERDRLTAKQLKDLKGLPGYISEAIDSVLDEGPGKKNCPDGIRSSTDTTGDEEKFEAWYFYGEIALEDLTAMKVKVPEDSLDRKTLPAIVTLVNDTPIKACINPLDSGEFPYDVMPWQRRAGSCFGIGVARQGRTAQDMMNASARALMDNAGLSSGPMIILRQGAVKPANGNWEITARKVWIATEQADLRTVSDAFTAINIPMMQAELTAIMQTARQMMEEATGIMFLLQGQQGSAPDTVGGMELLHKNASATLRRLARVFDERITEPHIRRYYDWLMLHGPDDCKGDFKIEAIGSTALVEREIQSMEAMQLLQMALNPAFGLDPEKAMEEVLKTKRLIPEKFKMDETKKKAMAAQQPMVPAIEVAKIRAQADLQIAEQRGKMDEWKTKVETQAGLRRMEIDTDRDQIYAQTMANRDQSTATVRLEELRLKRELAMMDYANKHNITIEQIKAKLASDAMKLRVQKELSLAGRGTQVVAPVAEPPGRARDGRAFEE